MCVLYSLEELIMITVTYHQIPDRTYGGFLDDFFTIDCENKPENEFNLSVTESDVDTTCAQVIKAINTPGLQNGSLQLVGEDKEIVVDLVMLRRMLGCTFDDMLTLAIKDFHARDLAVRERINNSEEGKRYEFA